MQKEPLKILSIIPYKILPAKLGGEKGIAVFNEYLAKQVQLTGWDPLESTCRHASLSIL